MFLKTMIPGESTGTNNPWPPGFHLPKAAEFEKERAFWCGRNAERAFNAPVKLAMTGIPTYEGKVIAENSEGHYWGNSVNGIVRIYLYVRSDSSGIFQNYRVNGIKAFVVLFQGTIEQFLNTRAV